MRQLAQLKVLTAAALAALVTAAACFPRFLLWPGKEQFATLLDLVLFGCAFVLWAFVFAWHTPYSQRPVFTLKIGLPLWATALVTAIALAALNHLLLDPVLRQKFPNDYPANRGQWIAMTLFTLFFQQLFAIYAPFAFFIRLSRSVKIATHLTVFFGLIIVLLKTNSMPGTLPLPLILGFVAARVLVGFLAIYFYLRGGVLLVTCWALIIQLRHLLDF